MEVKNTINKDLLILLKKGDKLVFEKIYNLHWKKLFLIAKYKIGDKEKAEEVVQEVFLTLWKKKNNLEIHNLSGYLNVMLKNEILKAIAKESALKIREKNYDNKVIKLHTIEENLDYKLTLEKVVAISESLPEKCKQAFHFNKIQDKSISEVAEKLNISQKTAEAHITKALKHIRNYFKENILIVLFFISI